MFSSIRGARGFSIYELMTVVAIIAIALAWGFPSFMSSIRTNRVATRTNELVTTLNLARSEAISRGNNVVVCASNTGNTCAGDWGDGWITFNDGDNGIDIDDPANDILRVTSTQEGMDATSAGSLRTIAFDSRGMAVNLPVAAAERVISLEPDNDCPSSQNLIRRVRLAPSGQVSTSYAACP